MSARGPVRRDYSGVPAQERRQDRRSRLIEAGLDVIGSAGFPDTTVRAVCRGAGLTERYFYESFAGREELLVAVFDHVVALVRADVDRALAAAPDGPLDQVRAGVAAFLTSLTQDRRRARVQLFETTGVSDRLEARRRHVVHDYVRLLETIARTHAPAVAADPAQLRVACLAVAGGLDQLAVAWTRGEIDLPIAEVVEHATEVFARLLASYAAEAAGGRTGRSSGGG